MTAYGWFLLVTIVGPILVLVVPQWRPYFPNLRGLVFVWLFVSTSWLILDAWQHAAGFWGYNPQYVSQIQVLNLPLEEALFFYLIPLATLVLWHAIPVSRTAVLLGKGVVIGQILLALLMLFAPWPLPLRSAIDLVLCLVALGLIIRLDLLQRPVLAWTAVTAGCFLVANTYLTALPIVLYNADHMVPWRLGTIPVSDIHYNLAFLWLVLAVYLKTKSR